jgi:hypothetical protein
MGRKMTFSIVVLIVSVFLGYLLGYSIPPFIHAGVFSDRAVKGVAIEVDKEMEEYYKNLTEDEEE